MMASAIETARTLALDADVGGALMVAPFASAATDYRNIGLAVLPCNGKVPLIKGWRGWSRPPSPKAIAKWEKRFQSANIGCATEPSQLTIVDVDHPEFLDPAIDEFGETPAIARTGKGFHLYYRHAGEKTATNFCPSVDIRGAGGFAVLPPSIHSDSSRQYVWAEGGIDDLAHLPKVKSGSLPLVGDTFPNSDSASSGTYRNERNNALFREARLVAYECLSQAELERRLLGLNATLFHTAVDGPLPEAQVKNMAKGVWKYRENGTIVLPGQSHALAYGHEIDSLNPDALYLLLWLRKANLGRNDTFPISPKGLAQVLHWGWQRVSKARDLLLARSLIEQRSEANPGKGKARHFAFSSPIITESVNYIKDIPPPLKVLREGKIT